MSVYLQGDLLASFVCDNPETTVLDSYIDTNVCCCDHTYLREKCPLKNVL